MKAMRAKPSAEMCRVGALIDEALHGVELGVAGSVLMHRMVTVLVAALGPAQAKEALQLTILPFIEQGIDDGIYDMEDTRAVH